jgi:AraC-like DNA-binding protein
MNRRGWGMGHGVETRSPRAPSPVPPALFRYTERAPSIDAAAHVLTYWSFQADAAPLPDERYTVFPDGCASVAFVRPLQGPRLLVLVGPRISPLHPPVYPGSRIWGLRLWPDAIGPVLGIGASSLRDYFGPLPATIANRFSSLPDALPESDDTNLVFPALDSWTGQLLTGASQPDVRIRAAVREIVARKGEGSMEQVAKVAAIGLRQLQRLFPATTGLTLREYARVRRLREALALRMTMPSPSWSTIAAETGFVDHAHLTREFVALAGIPPRVAAEHVGGIVHHEVRP